MKVFGLSADQQGCGYYRIGLPLHVLKSLGHETWAGTAIPAHNESHLPPPTIDLVVGQRLYLPNVLTIWEAMAEAGRRTVFEIDDNLWDVDPSNANARATYALPEVKASLTRAVSMATAVTVPNDHLAEVVSQWNSNVFVLPNYIDEALLTHERPQRAQITIGWAGGFSHHVDFHAIEKQLHTFFARETGVRCHIMGYDYRAAIGRTLTRYTPWQAEVWDYYRSIDFDIGIAPLAETSFNRSKSYIKALEYAALGIPVIASNVGPYREFVQDGVTGFLVKNNTEWTRRLAELSRDAELRERMGSAARELARDHTIQANAWRWEKVYQQVVPDAV